MVVATTTASTREATCVRADNMAVVLLEYCKQDSIADRTLVFGID